MEGPPNELKGLEAGVGFCWPEVPEEVEDTNAPNGLAWLVFADVAGWEADGCPNGLNVDAEGWVVVLDWSNMFGLAVDALKNSLDTLEWLLNAQSNYPNADMMIRFAITDPISIEDNTVCECLPDTESS